MAFSIGSKGNILEQFANAVTDAFGLTDSKGSDIKALFDPKFGGPAQYEASRWTGNTYPASGRKTLQYGFAILVSDGAGGFKLDRKEEDTFFLQVAPQSIQQKEVFATNIQATRKGVIVESEGVVFKEIVISGTTGIFPGERAAGTNPIPDLKNPTAGPKPPAGVDPSTGKSQRASIPTSSGYEEFLKLRQFFLKYGYQKVSTKGKVFFGFINQKDNQYLIVEPLEFVMERSARSPLTYEYRIVLKAITSFDQKSEGSTPDDLSFFDKVSNISANISATLAASKTVINATEGALVSITQALDNVFITPFRQLKLAVDALNSGSVTVLSLPATLAANANSVSKTRLAVAEQKDSINSSVNHFSVGQRASGQLASGSNTTNSLATDDLGNVTDTGSGDLFSTSSSTSKPSTLDASTINGTTPSILNADGSLSENLTPQQYTEVIDILNQLDSDPAIPVPRSFVEELRANTTKLRDDLADSVGLGSSGYDSIIGRTVTHPASPLTVPTDQDYQLLGVLQDIISAVDKILADNRFFQSGVDGIYDHASASYGDVASIKKPATVREALIEFGDSLESIALREYGDATRWVDLVVLNNLRSPYILDDVTDNKPYGTKMPGETILIGNT